MEEIPDEDNAISFPSRMFAIGHEPHGVHATPYHKPQSIKKILNALDIDEVGAIRNSPFGQLVEISEQPSFSGRFGRFLLSRQLKVDKKYETWFLFARKPVRFSIREFAAVTGFNCNKYPRHAKKRSTKNFASKPYWVDLFGTMKEVPVKYVVSMLRKKTVTDKDLRMKYALLALLSAVILPTSHNPRINEDHAEMIKDINDFFAYPWGRVSFEMLISSIKERDEVSLSQKTIALKGFVLSLQLVMIKAVPALTGVVEEGGSSCYEGESPVEDDNLDDDNKGSKSINPSEVRKIHKAEKAMMYSIISAGEEDINVNCEAEWDDEEVDVLVDNLVKCIQEGFQSCNAHFTAGASKADVVRMREEALKKSHPSAILDKLLMTL